MTGFIVSVFLFRNRASSKEAFEGLELGEGKLSRPVLRGPGGRKAAWLLGSYRFVRRIRTASNSRSIVGEKPAVGSPPMAVWDSADCRHDLLFLKLVVWNNDWIIRQRTHDRCFDLRTYPE
jgi:hypothetical protein